MEYCGGGSVSDLMRLRQKTLTENEMGPILKDTLLGLEYLHDRSKIHRDVKAGNILLNNGGHAKLADFGVAGQLTVSAFAGKESPHDVSHAGYNGKTEHSDWHAVLDGT